MPPAAPTPFTLAQLPEVRWTPAETRAVGRLLASYLDIAGTAMGRATYYNTRAEQAAAEDAVHAALFALSRELYGKLATLPGVTDTTRIRVALRLLAAPGSDLPDEAVVLRAIADPERIQSVGLMQVIPLVSDAEDTRIQPPIDAIVSTAYYGELMF